MNDIKEAFKKFLISMIGRTFIFAVIMEIEKIWLITLCIDGLEMTWQLVALIGVCNLTLFTFLGLIKWEKLSLKASIGS